MKIKPLKNYVLIKLHKKEKTTKSGIFIPDRVNNKENNRKGEVIEIGNKVLEDIKIGDIVIFSLSALITEDDIDSYYIVREEDILAVIN